MTSCNIVLAGVGGQGILLAAEILGTAAVNSSLNVRVSELHGMAQRGGAVVSHVRIGEKVYAPTVLDGAADLLVGFEPMEALRNIKYASQRTMVLVNTNPFKITGVEYPRMEEIFVQIRKFTKNVEEIDAVALARRAGAEVTRNIVMLGALAATERLPMKPSSLKEAMQELVPKKYLDVNVKSFEFGYGTIRDQLCSST